jgi:hypothetical protein
MLSHNFAAILALVVAATASVSATTPGMAKVLVSRENNLVDSQPCTPLTPVGVDYPFQDGPQWKTLTRQDGDFYTKEPKLSQTAQWIAANHQLFLIAQTNAAPKNIFMLKITPWVGNPHYYAYWLNQGQNCQVRVPGSTAANVVAGEKYEFKVQELTS